jgi:hypothetical protein
MTRVSPVHTDDEEFSAVFIAQGWISIASSISQMSAWESSMPVMVYAQSKIASGSNFRAYFAANLDGERHGR